MNKQLRIENWTWECGDGCCSDSGCTVYIGDAEYNKRWIAESRMPIDGEGYCIPAYIVHDAIDKVCDHKRFDAFREHFFKACGRTDDIQHWHYSNKMADMTIEQAKVVFKYFDIDVDIYITGD